MQKKIIIFINSLARGGGAEKITALLIQELSKTFEIHLILLENNIDYSFPWEVKLYIIGKSFLERNFFFKFSAIPIISYKLLKYCKKHDISTIVSFLNRPNFVSCFMKFYSKSYYHVLNQRNSPSGEYPSQKLKDRIGRLLIRKLYSKANVILTNCYAMRDELVEGFHIKAPCKVIYNPVIKNCINAANNIFPNHKSNFVFATMGRLIKSKNIVEIIKALSLIEQNAILMIIGKGEEERQLKEYSQELNIEYKVFFTGFQLNPYKYLKTADCFVFNSLYEGFPNALLDALSCGLPIISTDCPTGPRGIISPSTFYRKKNRNSIEIGDCGILIPVQRTDLLVNAMRIVMQDNFIKERLKQKALERAKDFRVDNFIDEFKFILSGFFEDI